MIGPTNAQVIPRFQPFGRYGIKVNDSTFSSGKNLQYAYDFDGFEPLDNSATTGTMNSSMNWGSWQYLENNSFTKDWYYSLTYSDGEEVRLNPYNLAVAEDGTDVSELITQNNVLLNIPKMYVSSNMNGYSLSKYAGDGDALAHTIDGDEYDYVGYGVYPSVISGTKAMSISGVKPSASQTRITFRSYSKNNGTPNNGLFLQWNWYHYNLIRQIVMASTLNWDSQGSIGKGNLSGSNANNWVANGFGNSLGLFAGSQSSGAGYGCKAFIENLWGECWQFVDDIVTGDEYADGGYIWKDIWAGQNSTVQCTENESSSDSGAIITNDKMKVGRMCIGPNTGNISAGWKYASQIEESSRGWGLPISQGGSTASYTFDGYYTRAVTVSSGQPTVTVARNFSVGGASNLGLNAGLSALDVSDAVRASRWYYGSRLAFVHD